jgi:hypothetical protein
MIIFYHEFDSLSGGGAVLILNLIKGFTADGRDVLLINFENGVISRELAEVNPSRLTIVNNDKDTIKKVARKVNKDDIILSTHFYTVFRYFLPANPKFFFYCVGHLQFYEANRFGKINFLGLTKKLVGSLREKDGLLFIETNALNETINMFHLKDPEFPVLPIPVIPPKQNQYLFTQRASRETINFTYVGRAVDTKIFPIQRVVADIDETGFPRPINFYIITDDAAVFKKGLGIESSGVNIIYRENLSQAELDGFLLNNSDIHFAQATSALEGAKLGIPTILLDFSFTTFPKGYLYKFVYQTAPAYIGTDANQMKRFEGLTMKEILDLNLNKKSLEQISTKSYSYILEHHNLFTTIHKLSTFLDSCTVRLKDIQFFLIRYYLQRFRPY